MAETLVELVARITADATELKKALAESEKAVEKTSKTIGQSLEEWAKKNKEALRAVGVAFTAIGVAGLAMVSTSKELNAALGQTGITVGKSTKEMRELALSVTDVTFPLESVTATFELLARAGIRSTDEMKSAAKAFDALADATGSSAEVVANTLIPAFKVFGINIADAEDHIDKLTWLTKNTTINLSEFGSVMEYVAMYGSELGVTLDDMVAIMAALEARGMTGAAATRLFRTAVNQAKDGAISLNDALGVSQEQIDGYKTKLSDATGITNEYADMANTQFTIMDKVKQKFSELTLSASGFLEPLEPLLAGMTALGPLMIGLSSKAGIAAVKWGLYTFALIAHTVALVASAVAIKVVTAAQWLWNVAMAANPIGLIILAIAALIAIIVLIAKNWDTVREKTIEVWNSIVGFLRGIWDNIVGFFKENWDLILAILFPSVGLPILIIRHWQQIATFFKDLWEGIKNTFKNAVNFLIGLAEGFVNFFLKGINSIINALNAIQINIPDWVPGLGGKTFGVNISPVPEVTLPRLKYGGVVPGQLGQPVPIIAHGGEEFLGIGNRLAGGGDTINVYVQGSVITERELAEIVRDAFYDIKTRNVTLEMA